MYVHGGYDVLVVVVLDGMKFVLQVVRVVILDDRECAHNDRSWVG